MNGNIVAGLAQALAKRLGRDDAAFEVFAVEWLDGYHAEIFDFVTLLQRDLEQYLAETG